MGSRRVNYTAAQRRAEHYANRLSTLGLTLTGEPTHPLPPDSTQSATDGAEVTRYLSRIWIVDSGTRQRFCRPCRKAYYRIYHQNRRTA